jgi:predicted site-specific integrase-resolvase
LGARVTEAPPETSALRGIDVIACYCRVSSARQKTDSQKAEIRRWLLSNGIDPSTVVWFEDKETGRTLKRSAVDRLQKAIFAGTIKTVVVWKLDRLSRRQRDGVDLLADWCERGVRVVAVTQQIDLSGAVGRMVASVLFGLAKIESEYRRERQAAGIVVAKEGVFIEADSGTQPRHHPVVLKNFVAVACWCKRSPPPWASADGRPYGTSPRRRYRDY